MTTPALPDATKAAEQTGRFKINMEPSYRAIAVLAIMLIESGDGEEGKEKGRELVRDMGEKLAQVRATQTDCPDHLK